MTDPKKTILDQAAALGFDGVRVTRAVLPAEVGARMAHFVAAGQHGTMAWMEDRLTQRAQPKMLWPEARSALVLAVRYGSGEDPLEKLQNREAGNISCYALGDDYHDVVKKKLKALGRFIADEFGCALKVFVDTAPVAEKPLAAQAGLGWQGKHTNLVSRNEGSWFFIGVIYLALDLPEDDPETDHCGSCQACLDICPTDAFPAPYQLDARRCISYLTIEHKGPVPEEFRKAMGNRIYGCDDCLAVCPWNKFAGEAREAKLAARAELKSPPLSDLARLDDAGFRALFRKSPIKRIGRDRFVRNVAIAIGNSGNEKLRRSVAPLLEDDADIVRDAAQWADYQLADLRRG